MCNNRIMNDALRYAEVLWDFNVLNQNIEKADFIIALGNSDIRTAQKAAELFKDGYGGAIITTGGFGRLTKDKFVKPEAHVFADEAVRLGVPVEKILIEDSSTNTFDNIRFTKILLDEANLKPKSVLIVTKPYMERRALMTASAVWPNVHILVASPKLTFSEYANELISTDLLINMVVGDTQRLMIFSQYKYIQAQEFPEGIVKAYEALISLGYTEQIIPEENIPNLLEAVSEGNISKK
jgi:uncharacterized SAM-binding protein YcdF (DUF218 family)